MAQRQLDNSSPAASSAPQPPRPSQPRRPSHPEPSDLPYAVEESAGQTGPGPLSAPAVGSPAGVPDRTNVPQRSSTYGSPLDFERSRHHRQEAGHAKSEDLNHVGTLPAASPNSILNSNARVSPSASTCFACGKPMSGDFVRALGAVYHLNCFKCMDCGTVVASKFFPVDGPDGRQFPLCERDYFRRLNLICATCGMALRGSYITACNKKYHVEHFTCSICTTLFGPQDSYYEHAGDVFCHYHYSTRFATKCAGCSSAILKQFVEINRNNRDECWHPECYMINKFWNVKLVSRRSIPPPMPDQAAPEPEYVEEERKETANSLKDKQGRMEQQVYRIWTVLSAFEESSAACISDMLRQVSNGQYLDAIRMAEKFILHVEVLFAAIDDLEYHFARLNQKGMSHVREARMLCRKTVDLFTLLSHTQETGSRRIEMTQELLALVTGLAHYLKILIRIALTGALKLDREQNVPEAISSFLDKLHLLAVQGGNPNARRAMKGAHGEMIVRTEDGNAGTQGVTYGFKSLAPESAGDSPFCAPPREPSQIKPVNPPSDLCIKCSKTVEEDCVRLGSYQRWHSQCVQCQSCGKVAAVPSPKEKDREKEQSPPKGAEEKEKEKDGPKLSTVRRPPANVDIFVYDESSMTETPSFGRHPTTIFCTDDGHQGCKGGFLPVSRLEQYAFLLNVALRRLYILLKKRGVVPQSPVAPAAPSNNGLEHDPYRNSGDIMRMKSMNIGRKLSTTTGRGKRGTIVESPAGKTVQPTDLSQPQRSQDSGMRSAGQLPPPTLQPGVRPLATRPAGSQPPNPGQMSRSPGPPTLSSLDVNDSGANVIRRSFGRSNTEVMIVEESGPNSPSVGPEYQQPMIPANDGSEDGITLADIPQLMEAAQAREQRRSLPHQTSIPFIAELTPLELAIVKHCAVLVLHGSPLRDHFNLDEILELVETKKSTFWNKFWKGSNDKKIKKKGVFGVPLELLVEREGADCALGASRTTLRVPSFIEDVVSAMRQMDMSVEGVFRKSGNIRRLKDLTEAIDRDPSAVDLTTDNPVQLAALLKKFLRDLPEPLMTFKLYRLWVATQSLPHEEDRKRMLHMVSLILPKHHRDTLEVLFVFLKWVASFAHLDEETGSKMDLGNLAIVICPSIIYSGSRDGGPGNSLGDITVVTTLLENQDRFFSVPEEFTGILRDQEYFAGALELPGKEFMKKCGMYMKMKAGTRTPGLMSPTIPQPFMNSPGGSLASMAKIPDSASDLRGPTPQRITGERERNNSSPPESQFRTAQTGNKRQQSPAPPPLNHSPMSFPPPAGASSSMTQTMAGHSQPAPDAEWLARRAAAAAPQPGTPQAAPMRPPSFAQTPRSSGEHQHPFSPNGQGQPMQVRQRT